MYIFYSTKFNCLFLLASSFKISSADYNYFISMDNITKPLSCFSKKNTNYETLKLNLNNNKYYPFNGYFLTKI